MSAYSTVLCTWLIFIASQVSNKTFGFLSNKDFYRSNNLPNAEQSASKQ